MGVAAAVAGVAAVVGAGATIYAADQSSSAISDAANSSNATQLAMYNQTRADQAPARTVGYGALGKLAAMYGVSTGTSGSGVTSQYGSNDNAAMPSAFTDSYSSASSQPYGGFTASPGYQFRVDEAKRAIQNSAAARGLLNSGATVKALNTQIQGVASDEYNTYANRLAALAGVGQTATNTTDAAGQTYANATSTNNTNAASANASAYGTMGSAINSGVQNAASGYLYSKGYGSGLTGQYGIVTPSASLYADAGNTIAANQGVF